MSAKKVLQVAQLSIADCLEYSNYMSTPLGDWKDALEDVGVMGLVPPPSQPMPTAAVVQTTKPPLFAPTPIATPQYSATKAKEATTWQVPTDPAKNPPLDAITACENLDALNACIYQCEACPLGAGRIKFVFGEGSPNAQMMFVGEGPGSEEDIMGRPFVGRAGALLDKMIGALSMARSDVYIANIVKCRPPDNRVPTPIEAQTCIRYLMRQIELIKPNVIVGLGATPLREMIGIPSGITKLRGTWRSVKVADREIPYMPTFHPAYVLRSYTKEVRQAVWEDLKAAKQRAEEG
jgi:DNA polymerase